MSNKVNCNVIQDLLPSYIDELCSEESRQMVEEHLKECAKCRAMLSSMKEDIIPGKGHDIGGQAVDEKKIIQNVNKKIKRDIDRRLMVYRCIMAVIILGILVMFLPIKTVPKSKLSIEYQAFNLSECMDFSDSREPITEDTVYLKDDDREFDKAMFLDFQGNIGYNLKIDALWASKHDYITAAKIISKCPIKNYSYSIVEEGGKKILCLDTVKSSFIGGESEGEYIVNIIVPDKIDDYRIY